MRILVCGRCSIWWGWRVTSVAACNVLDVSCDWGPSKPIHVSCTAPTHGQGINHWFKRLLHSRTADDLNLHVLAPFDIGMPLKCYRCHKSIALADLARFVQEKCGGALDANNLLGKQDKVLSCKTGLALLKNITSQLPKMLSTWWQSLNLLKTVRDAYDLNAQLKAHMVGGDSTASLKSSVWQFDLSQLIRWWFQCFDQDILIARWWLTWFWFCFW